MYNVFPINDISHHDQNVKWNISGLPIDGRLNALFELIVTYTSMLTRILQ